MTSRGRPVYLKEWLEHALVELFLYTGPGIRDANCIADNAVKDLPKTVLSKLTVQLTDESSFTSSTSPFSSAAP